MSIYFDFKTINELTRDNSYNQERVFTLNELAQYDGNNGNRAYVAVEGIVYDVSNLPDWRRGAYFNLTAGADLTDEFNSCQEIIGILSNAPRVGILKHGENMNYGMPYNRQANKSTANFTPDDWVRYITPIINYALTQTKPGSTTDNNIYQRIVLMGVLVGLGRTPREAIDQLQEWQETGKLKLLKGTGVGMAGGTGTSGGMGTGFGTGTTGGTGTGIGTGMTGGVGTSGGMGTGFGTGTIGGTGTGVGAGMTGGAGTSGGMGTGFGIGKTGGTGVGTGTGMTGGTGTTGGTSTTSGMREDGETSDRLIFD